MKINITDSTRTLEAKQKRLINLHAGLNNSLKDLDILEMYIELKLYPQVTRVDINKNAEKPKDVLLMVEVKGFSDAVIIRRMVERKFKELKVLQDIPGYATLIIKPEEEDIYQTIPLKVLGDKRGWRRMV